MSEEKEPIYFAPTKWSRVSNNQNKDNTDYERSRGRWYYKPKDLGVLFSREKPFPVEDVIRTINNSEKMQEAITVGSRTHDVYFIMHVPKVLKGITSEDVESEEIGVKYLSNEYVKNYPLIYPETKSMDKYSINKAPDKVRYVNDIITTIPISNSTVEGTYGEVNVNSHRFSKLGTTMVENRYIATPGVDSALSIPLHPSTLNYSITLVDGYNHYTVRYEDMWKECPLVQGLSSGTYSQCTRCKLRGRFCRYKWFKAALKAKGYTLKDDRVSARGDEYSVLDDNSEKEGDLTELRQLKTTGGYRSVKSLSNEFVDIVDSIEDDIVINSGEDKNEHLFERCEKRYVARLISKGKRCDPQTYFVRVSVKEPNNTYLSKKSVRQREEFYRKNAEKAAKSKYQRKETCGVGEDACVLKEKGCDRWKAATYPYGNRKRCNRRWSSPKRMLFSAVKDFMENVEHTEDDFLRALNFAGRYINCIDPETARVTSNIIYSGLEIKQGKVFHIIRRVNRGNDIYPVFQGSWEEMGKFLRKHSYEGFNAWKAWSTISGMVEPEVRVFYAECAAKRRYPDPSGWGYHSYSKYAFHKEKIYINSYSSNHVTKIVSGNSYKQVFHYTANNTKINVNAGGYPYFLENIFNLAELFGWDWFKWIPA